jgi:hypothetical protein
MAPKRKGLCKKLLGEKNVEKNFGLTAENYTSSYATHVTEMR